MSQRSSAMASNDQSNLSERLQLLHELGQVGYLDLNIPCGPYHPSGVYSYTRSRDNHVIRILDTIAAALTTGKPGEVFAAAFDKQEHIELVLAKNGLPTSQDVAAANELISLIGSVTQPLDLFPFLLRRCGANIDKRISSLHISIQNTELRDDFQFALQTYAPMSDIRAEFPDAADVEFVLRVYENAVPPFAVVWGDLVEKVTNMTAHGLDAEDISSSRERYAALFIHADALACSCFLKNLVDHDLTTMDSEGRERVEKLKRCLGKVCLYVRGIAHLIRNAKRLFPIPHRWVMDTFPGAGEGDFDLCNNAYDAVSRALEEASLSPDILDKLYDHFPSILSNWGRQQTVHALVHAEVRIILHLGPLSPDDLSVHPIGVSKRSCLCCALWIESHSCISGMRWMTSGFHGKPYANWALPGAACTYAIKARADGKSLIDSAVLEAVNMRLGDTLHWIFLGQKRILDSDDDSSDNLNYELRVGLERVLRCARRARESKLSTVV
jgi:hypothetical protein